MAKHRKPSDHCARRVVATSTGAIAIITLAGGTANAAPDWNKLAQCETGGVWTYPAGYPAGGDNGFDGGLQFLPSTWIEFGGLEYAPTASQATREQQIAIAEKVLAVQGPQAWPDCSNNKVPGWWDALSTPIPIPAPVVVPAPLPPPPAPAPATGNSSCYLSQSAHGGHDGIDIACDIGTPVRAAADGVIEAGTGFNTDPGGYGNYIQQSGGLQYGHLSEIYVSVGDWVRKGDVIGAVGNAGSSTGPHLHFRSPGDELAFLGGDWQQLVGSPAVPAPMPDPLPVVSVPDSGVPIAVFEGLASAYVVECGDTLAAIAERFGTTVQAILDLNQWIGIPDLIFTGDQLRML